MPSKRQTRAYIREGDKAIYLEEDEQELLAMSRKEVIADLTEMERKFCEFYVHNFNIKVAAIKAGYSPHSANIVGWRVRQKYEVNRYIGWLKLRLSKRLAISAEDFIDQYAKVAFADITDFISITERGSVRMKPADQLDGQIIRKLKEGPHGLEIELEDRMKALEKLESYFDVVPASWRQKIEERKVAILEERLEMDKEDRANQEFMDDGFIEALKAVNSEEIWDETEEDMVEEA